MAEAGRAASPAQVQEGAEKAHELRLGTSLTVMRNASELRLPRDRVHEYVMWPNPTEGPWYVLMFVNAGPPTVTVRVGFGQNYGIVPKEIGLLDVDLNVDDLDLQAMVYLTVRRVLSLSSKARNTRSWDPIPSNEVLNEAFRRVAKGGVLRNLQDVVRQSARYVSTLECVNAVNEMLVEDTMCE